MLSVPCVRPHRRADAQFPSVARQSRGQRAPARSRKRPSAPCLSTQVVQLPNLGVQVGIQVCSRRLPGLTFSLWDVALLADGYCLAVLDFVFSVPSWAVLFPHSLEWLTCAIFRGLSKLTLLLDHPTWDIRRLCSQSASAGSS